jgi:hypothetical protein
VNHCDNYFVVCVRGGGRREEECRHTGEVGTTDFISFGSRAGNLPNPIPFEVDGPWTGGLVVIVDVYDDDDIFPATLNGDEFIDWFLLTAPTGGLVTLRGQSGRRVYLTLSVTISCSEGYYGADCSVQCEPNPPYYTCGSDGGWVCLEGWRGDRCDVCQLSPHCCECDPSLCA